jgi:hypothetical protein
MLNWLLNKFRKCPYELPPEPETETYEVGEVDLVFHFKDGFLYIRSFIGEVNVEYEFTTHYDIPVNRVKTAVGKAVDFIQDRQDFGWIMINKHKLVPVSDIVEIFVIKQPHLVTVKKL